MNYFKTIFFIITLSFSLSFANGFYDNSKNKKQRIKITDLVIEKVESVVDDEIYEDDEYIEIEDEQNSDTIEYYTKPKLSIIIDDVSNYHEVKMIKKIPYKVTPSFFPPTDRFPDTPELALLFKFYMVHLPLQAKSSFVRVMQGTLNIHDSQLTIERRIVNIKEYFPEVKFINNHTGSAFTSDYNAMFKLYYAVDHNGLIFVDSRTIGSTKAKEVAEAFNIAFLERNVFLDNKLEREYIRTQLKKAVKIAKRRGYAIAIAHPKTETLSTLRNSSDLLNGVELVYINELK